MKCTLVFSYLACIVFLFSCLPMVELCDNDPDKVYCDPKRRVWYDKNANATMQMVPGNGRAVSGTNKVYEKLETDELKKDTIAICLKENGVTYDDFIRLINMELPRTYQGKCFLGCILHKNGLFTSEYEPSWFVHSTLARTLGPFLVTAMNTFGSKFIFSGDSSIYKGIELKKYMNEAKDMAIKCLQTMENLTAGMKKKKQKDFEKCERMNEYLKCASNLEEFPNIKKVSYEIRRRKLEYKKQLANTPKPDPNPSKGGGKKQGASSRTAVKHTTYADYCAAAFQKNPPT